ncbi:helix-turn-helix transcriptional regulator [Sphingobacterium chuzhouense]|uniref:Helix-turn-helix transcriptional regulator n=1 Tax=Sphingobacterium chuzhouense TaxID=1742264 RepID=A0ABR7XRN8_9SPHI|nr:helix-turn-helix transcriptional regulator [Sphingobacterium chuzhouense]MBD1421841.1 helix-turn-helix transcriptional regulator [Sphingobacterium chuzhouense]
MDTDLYSFKINLGKRIKALREERGLTQPVLGALIDKDYQVLGRIENGRVNPSSFLVYQIASALKVTMSEIFDFSKLSDS